MKPGKINQVCEQNCLTGAVFLTWCYNECKYFYNTKEKIFPKYSVSMLIAYSSSISDIAYAVTEI